MEERSDDGIVVLHGKNGNDLRLYFVAGVKFEEQFYAILKPCDNLPEGMAEDEAFVFHVARGGGEGKDVYTPCFDERVINGVFAEYAKMSDGE